MKFSVITPAYNYEKFIHKCLESIKNRIYTNGKLIIVNSAYTDKAQEIVNQFIENNLNKCTK